MMREGDNPETHDATCTCTTYRGSRSRVPHAAMSASEGE